MSGTSESEAGETGERYRVFMGKWPFEVHPTYGDACRCARIQAGKYPERVYLVRKGYSDSVCYRASMALPLQSWPIPDGDSVKDDR